MSVYRVSIRLAAAAAALACAAHATDAGAQTWTGAGGNANWSTAANWSPGVAPTNGVGGAATFSGVAAPLTSTVDVPWTLTNLTFANSNWTIGGNPLTFAGTGTVLATTGTFSIPNDVILGGATTFSVDTTSSLGNMSGGGALTKSGAGTLTAGNIKSTGQISVNAGTLAATLGNNNFLVGPVVVTAPGILQVTSASSYMTSLAGNGTVIAGSDTWFGYGGSTAFSGTLAFSSDSSHYTKNGPGTLTFSGTLVASSPGNYLQVSGGTLVLDGATVLTSIRVYNGTLSGTASLNARVYLENQGTIAPQSLTIPEVVVTGGRMRFAIEGTTPGTQYGQLVTVASFGLFGSPNPVLELTGSYVPVPGDRFDIISGAVGGNFAGLPSGSVIWFNGAPLKLTYEEGARLAYAAHDVTASVSGNGTITPSGAVNVLHGNAAVFQVAPAPNSHLVDVGGTCAGSLAGTTFSTGPIEAPCTVVANFALDTRTVTPSAGANGSISPDTAQTVDYGTTRAFTVTPATGYSATIGGTCPAGTLAPPTYTTGAIVADCTVAATFALNSYTVTPSAGPNGTVSPSDPQAVLHGATRQFTVTPSTGYTASVGGTCPGGALVGTTYTTGIITGNCTVSASFTIKTYTVNPSAGANGTISPTGGQSVNHGATRQFTVTPATGYSATIGGTCPAGMLVGTTYTTGAITQDCTVTASFALNAYTVTSSAGANGTISPTGGQSVNHGATIQFTVTPSTGYHAVFGGTCAAGLLSGTTYTTGPITQDCTVTASFALNAYTVTPSAGANGAISPDTPQSAEHGTTRQFTVTPNADYRANMGGTCPAGQLVGTLYTTGVIVGDCTVSATFSPIYTVTPSASLHGSISPGSPQLAEPGATLQFIVTPQPHYQASMGGTCPLGTLAGDTYTTGAITASCTVTATFTVVPIVFTVVLEGYQQVAPYVETTLQGTGTVSYNLETQVLSFGLFTQPMADTEAHIHGPAARGANGPVLFDLPLGSPKSGTVVLDAAQEAMLLAGELYVDIHSIVYPDGVLRGQIDNLGATVLHALIVTPPSGGSIQGGTEAGNNLVNCGARCGMWVPHGAAVTLVGIPSSSGSTIRWGGACSTTPDGDHCELTMDGDKEAEGAFVAVEHKLTVMKEGTGSGTVVSTPPGISCGAACAFDFPALTPVTLTATAAAGSSIEGWSGCDSVSSNKRTCTVTLASAHTVSVRFTAHIVYNVVLEGRQQVNPYVAITPASGGGTVTYDPVAQTVRFDLTATGLTNGFSFAEIRGPAGRGALGQHIGYLPDLVPFTTGFQPEVEAMLLAGQLYVEVFSNGFGVGKGELRGQIDNLGAAPTHALTITKAGQGTVTGKVETYQTVINCGPDCSEAVPVGKTVELTAAPGPGHAFAGWSGACTGKDACIVTMDAAKSVTATFDFVVTANPPRLGNISTRAQVLTGSDVMIGGFVIGGSVPKTIVVRARGPSLADAGIAAPLADPQLQLFSGATSVAFNDNWGDAANQADLQASGFAPAHAREAAILATLSPGAYTAIVTGVAQATGVAIIEVFEVDQVETPLVNISTRGRVQTDDKVMIAGFIIQGDGPQAVVVRARGPSLTQAGVPGALADPRLQLFSGSTLIFSNDDWAEDNANAGDILASGFAPSVAGEAAILMTLQPGAYTAIVSGVGGTTGVAIVEVFRN